MGIRGLSSYFSSREEFFSRVQLQNTQIIIDGNNLRYLLYRNCPATFHAFGGDYDKYARYTRHFFAVLTACGIRPVVVLDGAYEASEIKIRTVIGRMRDQASNAVHCNPETQYKLQVYPLLGKEVFLQVLRSLNISIIQTEFEADAVIGQLAIERGCPVLSNDSDFFVFAVDFVSLDSVDLEASAEQKSLQCEIFNREKFVAHYGLANTEMLHLFASILGNDYIPPSVFENIFGSIKLPKKTKACSERHRKIRGLLAWLGRESCTTGALDRLVSCYPALQRPQLKEKVMRSMDVYRGLITNVEAKEKKEDDLPAWFAERYAAGQLPNWCMDIIVRKKLFLQSQVELRERKCSHMAALPVYQLMVNLLNFSRGSADVELYSRLGSSFGLLCRFQRDPLSFVDVAILSPGEKEQLVLTALESGLQLSDVPTSLQLLLLVVDRWTRVEPVTRIHLYAILLCRHLLTYVDPVCAHQRSEKRLAERLKNPATPSHLLPALRCMAHYASFFHNDSRAVKKYEKGLVHSLAVFQALYYAALAINALLGGPFVTEALEVLYCGTFVYNMISSLTKRAENNASSWPSSLPEDENVAFLELFSLFDRKLECLNKASNAKAGVKKAKKSNRTMKASETADMMTAVSDQSCGEDAEESDYCDLGNKFAALAVQG